MIFVNELFNIPFKRDAHIAKGAPKEFYPNGGYQYLKYSDAEMDSFVKSRPDTWMRDLTFVEKTVKRPDRCRLEKAKSVADEYFWTERVSLRRTFERNGRRYACKCKLFRIDGRFCVPLVGRYAPSIKEVL